MLSLQIHNEHLSHKTLNTVIIFLDSRNFGIVEFHLGIGIPIPNLISISNNLFRNTELLQASDCGLGTALSPQLLIIIIVDPSQKLCLPHLCPCGFDRRPLVLLYNIYPNYLTPWCRPRNSRGCTSWTLLSSYLQYALSCFRRYLKVSRSWLLGYRCASGYSFKYIKLSHLYTDTDTPSKQ
jgi:hypothetical protein